MRVDRVGATDKDVWDEYVASNPHASAYHRYGWRNVIEGVLGRPCHYLAAREDNGRLRGVVPLTHLKSWMFGNYLVSIPYFSYGGILSDSPDVGRALLDAATALASTLGARHVELRQTNDDFPDLPKRVDKVAMHLDLPSDADALWKRFSSKLRAQIRRPLQEGASANEGGGELCDDFYRVFSRNMRDLGTPVYPKKFFEAIAANDAARTRFIVVRMGEQPVAAGLLVHHGEFVEIPWASSLRSHNRFGVNMLLYWKALQWSMAHGAKCFDFGRSTRDSGTFRFKRQWGAHPVQIHWHYLLKDGDAIPFLSPRNPKYGALIRIWQRLPVFTANLIGPYVVRYLP
jgi:serine/alanine adding enzyme